MNLGPYSLRDEVVRAPVVERELWEFTSRFSSLLPQEYTELLKASDGFEGFVGHEGKFIHFYSVAEVASRNIDYGIDDLEPDLLLVGDDLGGMGFFVSKSPSNDFQWAVIPLMDVGLADQQYRIELADFRHFADFLVVPWNAGKS